MTTIRPFLKATMPPYLLIAGMLAISLTAYEVSQALFGPLPQAEPGASSLSFFALFSVGMIVEFWGFGRLNKRYDFQNVRVPLSRHWRRVILDMIKWSNRHPNSEPVALLSGITIVGAIGEGMIFLLQAAHAPEFVYLVAVFGGFFAAFLVICTCQVLYRSTISPVGNLTLEEFEEINETLPKLSKESIEALSKERYFVHSPIARKTILASFGVCLVFMTCSMLVTFVLHYPNLRLPLAYVGWAAGIVAIALTALPISGKWVSSLSQRLQEGSHKNE